MIMKIKSETIENDKTLDITDFRFSFSRIFMYVYTRKSSRKSCNIKII